MKYLKVFCDFVIDMEDLNDDERGRLFTAMLEYASSGEEPAFVGNEHFVWGSARKQIDAQRKSYERMCNTNKKNVEKRYESTDRNESYQEQEQEQEQDKEQEQEQKKRKDVRRRRNSALNYAQTKINKADFDALVVNLGGEEVER